jgi:hypothetical protein
MEPPTNSDSNISNSTLYDLLVTQTNMIALGCFLALYICVYIGLGQVLDRQTSELSFQMTLSNSIDAMGFMLLIVYIVLFFTYSKHQNVDILTNTLIAATNFVN